MAKIIRNAGPVSGDAALAQAETLATTYWGDITNERMFLLPFWQVSQMLAVSGANEIALRVTNIDEPRLMSANWIVFEQIMADTLNDPVEQGVYYFILDDGLFNGPVLTATQPVFQLDGIRKANGTPHNNALRARIGKDDTTGDFFAFFLAVECKFITPGGGGGGALSGAKVPSV